ncbi:MAG: tRNA (adenosine(37)-N6)-threonylcarbamoyltransferase complex ATPase subunit type 1 TsaE [Patescibacteria group bacterium]|jgi:tRNA threonylcarbamoyladenosine biosynthesis protein TsaE
MTITTTSAADTQKLGLKLAKKTKAGEIFALVGDLGGGKTCFTKGFARGLGVKNLISSPSFVLMKIHPLKRQLIRYFCHVDAYRLKRPGEIIEAGLAEYLGRRDTVTVIEWADRIEKILKPYEKTWLNFFFIDKNIRKIKITKKHSE